jgi:hypothetical protein
METKTFVTLAFRLKYVSQQEAEVVLVLITEVSKMLTALRRRLLSSVG